jgi:hypothetical protein
MVNPALLPLEEKMTYRIFAFTALVSLTVWIAPFVFAAGDLVQW